MVNTNNKLLAKQPTILLNRLIKTLFPKINITAKMYDYDKKHYQVLKQM